MATFGLIEHPTQFFFSHLAPTHLNASGSKGCSITLFLTVGGGGIFIKAVQTGWLLFAQVWLCGKIDVIEVQQYSLAVEGRKELLVFYSLFAWTHLRPPPKKTQHFSINCNNLWTAPTLKLVSIWLLPTYEHHHKMRKQFPLKYLKKGTMPIFMDA